MCIGMRIAQVEGVAFLARLFQKFKFSPVPEFVPTEHHTVTLYPEHGMKVQISKKTQT